MEIVGIVREVEKRTENVNWGSKKAIYSNNQQGITKFIVYSNAHDKNFEAVSSFFTLVHEGDIVSFKCILSVEEIIIKGTKKKAEEKIKREFLTLTAPPFVLLGQDKRTIQNIFCKQVPMAIGRASNLYDHILLLERGEKNGKKESENKNAVVDYLDRLCQTWMISNDKRIFRTLLDVIKEDNAKKLCNWWYKNRILRRLYVFGLTNQDIQKCKEIGIALEDMYSYCLGNTFKLLPISVERCTEIFKMRNIDPPLDDKITAFLIRKIEETLKLKGWFCMPYNIYQSIIQSISSTLDYNHYLGLLKKEYSLVEVMEDSMLYTEYNYKIMQTIIRRFVDLRKKGDLLLNPKLSSSAEVDETIFFDKQLNEEQKKAVIGSLTHPITLITGRGGTGKTKIIVEIVKQLNRIDKQYKITSFTGKAVSRIRECFSQDGIEDEPILTLHMLLKQNLKQSGEEKETQSFHYMIVDEASMVTSSLFYEILQLFKWNFRIVFVGDCEQLPPIGSGALFSQLIESRVFPLYTLLKNHRSISVNGGVNGILENGTALLQYIPNSGGFYFQNYGNFQALEGDFSLIEQILRYLAMNGVKNTDMTVITPYNPENKKFGWVIQRVNNMCQDIFYQYLFKKKEEHDYTEIRDDMQRRWVVGDRVMMLENNYVIKVYNGEEGTITKITPEKNSITVMFKNGDSFDFTLSKPIEETPEDEFLKEKQKKDKKKQDKKILKEAGEMEYGTYEFDDDNELEYSQHTSVDDINRKERNEEKKEQKMLYVGLLTLSYAITIHKSQGSEYKFIIFYLPSEARNDNKMAPADNLSSFISKNLIYTAISRGIEYVWVIGAVGAMLRNLDKPQFRKYDMLAENLRREIENK